MGLQRTPCAGIIYFTWRWFNGNSFATSAAWAEVCALASAILVLFICLTFVFGSTVHFAVCVCAQITQLRLNEEDYIHSTDSRTFIRTEQYKM